MIPIKINIEFYTSKTNPAVKSLTLKYYYPINQGITIINTEMVYEDKIKIEKHFENLNEHCMCFLENNITIIFFSITDNQYEKFVRQIKISNIIHNI